MNNNYIRTEKVKRPLRRMIQLGGIAFFVVLCAILLFITSVFVSRTLYSQYQEKLDAVLSYVKDGSDADDLRKCIETGKKSLKYSELQVFFESVAESFGLDHLSLIIPSKEGVTSVLSVPAEEDRTAETDQELLKEDKFYSEKAQKRFLSLWNREGISCFREKSNSGNFYTGCMPLRDSGGKTVALICADLPVEDFYRNLRRNMLAGFAAIAAVCWFSCALLLQWLRKNVTDPILQLEGSARAYAENTQMTEDFASLRFVVPEIRTQNEVQSLAESIQTMASDMQEVAEEFLIEHARAQEASKEAQDFARAAQVMESIASLLDNMPGLTFSKDADTGVYLACNQAFAEFAHKDSPGEVAGLTDAKIFDPVTTKHFVEDDRIALSMDRPYIFFEDVLDAAGNPRQFQTTKLKYHDVHGRLCIMGICSDVTEMLRVKRENTQTKQAYEEARSAGIVYSRIAQALARSYFSLFYVNLETDEFVEYRAGGTEDDLKERRRGGNFFEICKRDAENYLYSDDRQAFLEAMDRKRLLDVLSRNRAFMMNYRMLRKGKPTYVNMKISRMENDDRALIIGVMNVDAQMKQQQEAERVKQERITYSRITALSGDYICIYTVDPQTDLYREYSSTSGYEALGMPKEGKGFFERSREIAPKLILPEDQSKFMSLFTRENVLRETSLKRIFSIRYRILLDGSPVHVNLRAAMVTEKNGPILVIGINDIDSYVRQEEEFENRLLQAQKKAVRDALTGVRNKHAYLNEESILNRQIEEGSVEPFAIAVFDVNDLKRVNDTLGHQAGDQFIKDACSIICRIFKESPVFRIGGDEFVVITRGKEYVEMNQRIVELRRHNMQSSENGGIIIACGMSRYDAEGGDSCVADVFRRADFRMYENKRGLKEAPRKDSWKKKLT